jgi:hypothetical protein
VTLFSALSIDLTGDEIGPLIITLSRGQSAVLIKFSPRGRYSVSTKSNLPTGDIVLRVVALTLSTKDETPHAIMSVSITKSKDWVQPTDNNAPPF